MKLYWLLLCHIYTFYSFAEESEHKQGLNTTIFHSAIPPYTSTEHSSNNSIAFAHQNTPPAPVGLQIYSKTKSCVHLRWNNTGDSREVNSYNIVATNSTAKNISRYTEKKSNCDKWYGIENSICVRFCKLKANNTYTFRVRAKYLGDDNYGNFSEPISTITMEEKPSPPANLKYRWSYLKLSLTWEHPMFPNGEIRSFNIYINDEKVTTYQTNDKARKTYHCTINGTKFGRQKLIINIESVNGAGRSKNASVSTTAPKVLSLPITTIITTTITPTTTNHYTKDGELSSITTTTTITPTTTDHDTKEADLSSITTITITPTTTDHSTQETELSSITTTTITSTTADPYTTVVESINGDEHSNNASISTAAPEVSPIMTTTTTTTTITTPTTSDPISKDVKSANKGNGRANNASKNITAQKMTTTAPDKSDGGVGSTDKLSTSLVALVCFILIGCIIASFRFYYVKRKQYKQESPKEETITTHFSGTTIFSQVVSRADFKNYITQEEDLLTQFQIINGLTIKLQTVGTLFENKCKNRYQNIVPYDDTRVILNEINDDTHSDYINATYINGFDSKKKYIAAQAPITCTVNDFWSMIWQENVECIVMLTDLTEGGKKKCERYWPSQGNMLIFNDVKVLTLQDTSIKSYVQKRLFQVQKNSETRMITQIHFTDWPDHGVPDLPSDLAEIILEVRKCNIGNKPILVHCSAGVGRTGTFILADVALDMAKNSDEIDVYRIFYELRQQRHFMVQTSSQYIYAHGVILDLLERDV